MSSDASKYIPFLDPNREAGQLDTEDVKVDTLSAADIAAGAVGNSELATDAVTDVKVAAAAAIALSKLATGALPAAITVASANIVDATIVAGDIASNAVETAKILNENVTTAKLAVNAVTTAKITDANVTNAKLKVPCIKAYQETFGVADMTDGGSTSGTFNLTLEIPKGAVVLQSFIDDVTGFAGDTSATITIGDGSDVDRYNTGTPNVFATADHISAGAASGTAYHAAAKTVTVTITSAADFTSVVTDGNGAVTITIFYYQSV